MEIIVIIFLYLLPGLIASVRNHHNEGSIWVINLSLGWTLVGWVVALAMSASGAKGVTR